jgi:iron complex outermembrane recepter protein
MLKSMTFRSTLAAVCCAISMSAHAMADTPKRIDVPAGELVAALDSLAKQSAVDLVYQPEQLKSFRTKGVRGIYEPQDAVRVLLKGTPLELRTDPSGAMVIAPVRTNLTLKNPSTAGSYEADENKEGKKSSSDEFRLAQVDQTPSGNQVAQSSVQSNQSVVLQEVIVTAQKREERLQDVPVPVTVLDTNALAAHDQSRIQDFFASVPGLSFNAAPFAGGQQTLAVRGITTGGSTTPTVGVTIDDVPYGSSTILGFGSVLVPDIDPSDLKQIEVLRGPQGTLYGASSIGGLIKFATQDPSTSGFAARVQALGDAVDHGDEGFAIRGAVNAPITDTFAIRASATARKDPGYVDNLLTGDKYANSANVYGGRISGLWFPADGMSLKVSAMVQATHADGIPAVDANAMLAPSIGDLKQARMPGTEGYDTRVQLYSAILKAKLGTLDFTSVSAYNQNHYTEVEDYTLGLTGLPQLFFPTIYNSPASVPGGSVGNFFETKKFTQELRLASDNTQTVSWLAGAFYTHEQSPAVQAYYANELTTGERFGTIANYDFPSSLSEYAIFTDLTFHITNRFDVQVGGRQSWFDQTYNEVDTGPLPALPKEFGGEGASPTNIPEISTHASATTYLFTPRYRISPDLMIYARLASGYRVGGPNLQASFLDIPLTYKPDKAYNYEVGLKADVLEHRLTIDGSLYYIDWKNIQVALFQGFSTYFANAGNAKSQGIELSFKARPWDGMTVGIESSLSDAELTQNFPQFSSSAGLAGDRLPFSSRFTGAVTLDQVIPIGNGWSASVGGDLSYVTKRFGQFSSAPTVPRFSYPAYADTDVHAGIQKGGLSIAVFMNNAFDRRGTVGGGLGYAQSPFNVIYIQPRTAGLSVTKEF